jgi:hypothetical protein
MTEIRYCIAPECDPPRPVAGHGKDLCSTHLKQVQRRGRTTEIAQKVSLEEQVFSAMERWADSGDSDAEYEANKRACIALAKRLGSKELAAELDEIRLQLTQTVEARRAKLRRALARARAAGVRLGRPPTVSEELLRRVFAETRSVAATARIVGLSYSTVHERLHRKTTITDTVTGPRLAG